MDDAIPENERAFERFAGMCAMIVGVGGLAYAITFVTVLRDAGRVAVGANATFLLVGGLLSSAVFVGVYRRLRQASPSFALWALLLAELGAAGAAIHGGYNLANAVHPPGIGTGALPNSVDPRGLLSFAVASIATLVFALLIVRSERLPRMLGYLGIISAALLLGLYLGRLLILNPRNPVLLGIVVLSGFLVNPAWYIWLGFELSRERPLAALPAAERPLTAD
jgi:hypothetical protein